MPLLPATMPVQELNVGGRQCVWHHDPGVQNLTGGQAHQGRVAMLPSGGSQDSSDSRRSIWLVATPYEQRDTSEQDVQCQTGVSVVCPAVSQAVDVREVAKSQEAGKPPYRLKAIV